MEPGLPLGRRVAGGRPSRDHVVRPFGRVPEHQHSPGSATATRHAAATASPASSVGAAVPRAVSATDGAAHARAARPGRHHPPGVLLGHDPGRRGGGSSRRPVSASCLVRQPAPPLRGAVSGRSLPARTPVRAEAKPVKPCSSRMVSRPGAPVA